VTIVEEGTVIPEEMELEEFLERLSPSLRIRILEPILFFREDVERLFQLLSEVRTTVAGEPQPRVEILTQQGPLNNWEEVLERRPHSALVLSIPEEGFSIFLLPHEVIIFSRYGWPPLRWDIDLLNRVERFLRRRRLPAFWGRREVLIIDSSRARFARRIREASIFAFGSGFVVALGALLSEVGWLAGWRAIWGLFIGGLASLLLWLVSIWIGLEGEN
jgi:hypothetical protein